MTFNSHQTTTEGSRAVEGEYFVYDILIHYQCCLENYFFSFYFGCLFITISCMFKHHRHTYFSAILFIIKLWPETACDLLYCFIVLNGKSDKRTKEWGTNYALFDLFLLQSPSASNVLNKVVVLLATNCLCQWVILCWTLFFLHILIIISSFISFLT